MESAPVNPLASVRCFLLDMDGTVYLGDRLFDGVPEILARMRAKGRVVFLTNNSSKSRDVYLEKLARLGIPASPEEVYTSGMAAAEYVRNAFPGARVGLLGTKALRREFEESGIAVDDGNPDLLVMGYDTELTYAKLVRFTDGLHKGLPFLATHPDVNCPAAPYFVPDIGAMLAMIKASTGRSPDRIIGKPHPTMGENLTRRYGYRPEEVAMVGDRLYTDIAFGNRCGFVSVLVFSGETSRSDYAVSDIRATVTAERIAELNLEDVPVATRGGLGRKTTGKRRA